MAAFVCAALITEPPRPLTWVIALVLVGVIASLGQPQAIGPIQFSVSSIVQIAAIPLLGAMGASLVAIVPAVTGRTPVVKRVFNTALRVLLVLAGSLAFHAAGGRILHSDQAEMSLVRLAAAMVAASVVAAVVNAGLLAGVIHRTSARPLVFVLRDVVPQAFGSYAVAFVAAYLLVVLWSPARLGWISALFFLPSILVIQWALRQLADEWTIRHEAVAPFVTALDVRHPGATEASRLAAAAASAIASAVGLRPSFVDKVVMSARLRDVGILALEDKPPAIVRRDHAMASASVLGNVGFLTEPLGYIGGHHERIDGHGWPAGLTGEAIPLGSRVLAVADAWSDAVMDGCTPDEALLACEGQVGASLDEVCVDALRRAHGRGQLPAVGR